MFGSIIWAGLVLVVMASVLETIDPKLAMLLVLVTLFALFLGNSRELVKIFQAITPRS